MALMRDFRRNAEKIEYETILDFHQTRNRARFLFGDDVVNALKTWHGAIIDMSVSHEMIKSHGGDSREHQPKIAAAMRIAAPFRDNLPIVFAPYLRMDQKRVRTPVEWLRDKNLQRLSYDDQR